MTKRVLTWVNAKRIGAGLVPLDQLPKGYRGSADGCPIALALADVYAMEEGKQLFVYPSGLEILNEDFDTLEKIGIPQYVGLAVKRFDQSHYPALEAGVF